MSIRKALASLAAVGALTTGVGLTAAPQADAASVCTTTPNVHCSMYWAKAISTTSTLTPGRASYQAKILQKALWNVRISVRGTGVFDAQTQRALRSYQTSRGIMVTGTATSQTLRFMRAGAGPRPASSTIADKAVKYAYAQIGKPYVSGATGPSAYDCSGLTYASYRYAGKSLVRTSYQQLSTYKTVSRSALRPGDIVGYYSGGHVGIYVGSGYIIHSSRPGVPVKKVPLSYMPYYKAVRPVG